MELSPIRPNFDYNAARSAPLPAELACLEPYLPKPSEMLGEWMANGLEFETLKEDLRAVQDELRERTRAKFQEFLATLDRSTAHSALREAIEAKRIELQYHRNGTKINTVVQGLIRPITRVFGVCSTCNNSDIVRKSNAPPKHACLAHNNTFTLILSARSERDRQYYDCVWEQFRLGPTGYRRKRWAWAQSTGVGSD